LSSPQTAAAVSDPLGSALDEVSPVAPTLAPAVEPEVPSSLPSPVASEVDIGAVFEALDPTVANKPEPPVSAPVVHAIGSHARASRRRDPAIVAYGTGVADGRRCIRWPTVRIVVAGFLTVIPRVG
jgi:hypothetical protein